MCDSDDDFLGHVSGVIHALAMVSGILGAVVGLAVSLLIGSDWWNEAALAGWLIGIQVGFFLGVGMVYMDLREREEKRNR